MVEELKENPERDAQALPLLTNQAGHHLQLGHEALLPELQPERVILVEGLCELVALVERLEEGVEVLF